MKLAEASQVISKLGVSEHGESIGMAESGLEFATSQIENVLDTSLRRSVVQDTFDFYPGRFFDSSKFVNLQLIATQGFWDSAETVQVYYTLDGTKMVGDLSGQTELDSSYYVVDYDQGTVLLLTPPPVGAATVAIRYTAGYEEGSDRIPQWLKQAAVGYACQNIDLHGVGYNKKEYRDKSKEKTSTAYSTLSQKIRTRNGCKPSLSATS